VIGIVILNSIRFLFQYGATHEQHVCDWYLFKMIDGGLTGLMSTYKVVVTVIWLLIKNSSLDNLISNGVCGCAFLEARCEGGYSVVKKDNDSVQCSCDSLYSTNNMDTCSFTQEDYDYVTQKIRAQLEKLLCKWHKEGFCGNMTKMERGDSISFLFYFDSTGFLFVMPDSLDTLAEYGLLDVKKSISRHQIGTVYCKDFHYHPENYYWHIGKLDLKAPCFKRIGVKLSTEALNKCSKIIYRFIPGE
jgi:hypothetical protein